LCAAGAGTIGGVATFVVGVIVGASLAALLIIVIAPSRRVRAEQAIPQDDVTRLLLGEDPDEIAIDSEPAVVEVEHPRNYDAKDLAALRSIGQRQTSGRRKR
jgi:hypothetical protein